MELDDLLCSRNARPQKGGKGSLVVLLLAERARSEGARSTRAMDDQSASIPEEMRSELGGRILSVAATSECTQLKYCL
jgi:hypothetical protein